VESSGFNITAFLKSLTTHPGIYRMLGDGDVVLYVGKAKNLKNRVSSYFRGRADSPKTKALVERIKKIEVTVTLSETEALLLEQTLIKKLKPPYNILFRDDKSYPYIYLSDKGFSRIAYHRGAKRGKGRYFGPYPSASAVKETLSILQKLFKVRQCEDSFYSNRSRPCLQHQIERCKAPCVGFVSEAEYAIDIAHTMKFLMGKSQEITNDLMVLMESASEALEFEQAGVYRDQIVALRHVQQQQFVTGEGGNVDVLGVSVGRGLACVQILYVRDGRVVGNKAYFPKIKGECKEQDVLEAFLPQYYLGQHAGMSCPDEIVIPSAIDNGELLIEAIKK